MNQDVREATKNVTHNAMQQLAGASKSISHVWQNIPTIRESTRPRDSAITDLNMSVAVGTELWETNNFLNMVSYRWSAVATLQHGNGSE